MSKQTIGGYTRWERGKAIKVPSHERKIRRNPGRQRKKTKTIKFRPKRPLRDSFGQIRGYTK